MEKAIFRRVRYALMRYLEERMLTQEREREREKFEGFVRVVRSVALVR